MGKKIDIVDVAVESADVHDLGKLARIMIAAYENLSHQYLNKALGPPGYNTIQGHLHWLAHDDYRKILHENKIIGGFILQNYHNTRFLGMIFIAIPYQRRGIGKYVLKQIEKSTKYNEIILNTPKWALHNQKFFEKHGYVKFKDEYDSNLGFNLIFYRKPLRK